MKVINEKRLKATYDVKIASAFSTAPDGANLEMLIRTNTVTHEAVYVVINHWKEEECEFKFSHKGKQAAINQYNKWIVGKY